MKTLVDSEDILIKYGENVSLTDLAWKLHAEANATARQAIISHMEGEEVFEMGLDSDRQLFNLQLLNGKTFYFINIMYKDEMLSFEGHWDDDQIGEHSFIEETDLYDMDGLLWIADYIINGVY